MANERINNYRNGDVNFDAIMTTLDAQRIGYIAAGLTEYDTTTIPEIAAGTRVEVSGTLFTFSTDESISGSPSDGDVYVYLEPTVGTAIGAQTDNTGYAIGSTVISLASSGTGTILAGDFVTFGSDTIQYKVTVGDGDVANGGSITIDSPGLLTGIPASSTAITIYAGQVTPNFTNTAPTWSDLKQGFYSGNNRYISSMVKDGTEYRNKVVYNFGREIVTMDFQTLTDYESGRSFTGGSTDTVVLTYDWDVEAVVNLTFTSSVSGDNNIADNLIIQSVSISGDQVTIVVKNPNSSTRTYQYSLVCTASKKRV